ncbi:MAG: amidohydrolase family protein [Pirellula sp.]|jgi:cytosine/adenosine deaminase-related metal-dependent hydrolase|nr:amidohydrolase family protein [Pirellula sp.]
MNRIAIKPTWLITMVSEPLRDHWLVASAGRIEFIGPSLPPSLEIDCHVELPNVAILPGLINTHCHLEFSDLSFPFVADGSFTKWIGDVVSHRCSSTDDPLTSRKRAIQCGVHESYSSGVRYVVDTITAPWSVDWVQEAIDDCSLTSDAAITLTGNVSFMVQACPEVLDIRIDRRDATQSHCREVNRATANRNANRKWSSGRQAISPHAPYTTSLQLVRETVQLLKEVDGIASMHLGESRDEIAWLSDRSGPMLEALKSFRDSHYLENIGTLHDYVRSIVEAPVALVAHGNYFTNEDLELFATHRQTAAIVHCARTFEHFHAHESYPLVERVARGVTHLLGTDSRASNPDLNLWAEVQTVVNSHSIDPEPVIAMITRSPAEFLGLSDLGTLEVGKRSLCTAIEVEGLALLSADQVLNRLVRQDTTAVPLERLL